jgi:septin family protein
MWNVKTNVIPIITGANETTSKSLTKYLSNILGKNKIKELQKAAMLVMAHIFRERTDVTVRNI